MPKAEPEALTVGEAAKFLQVDARTVVAMIEDGRLPAANVTTKRKSRRRNFRIARTALEKLLGTIMASRRRKRG